MFRQDRVLLSPPFVLFLLLTAVISPAVSGQSDGGDQGRHRRPDPLNNFRYYDGGFDIANKHYWASTAFTGVHGFAIAGVWSSCGVCLGLFLVFNGTRPRAASSFSSTRCRLDRYFVPLFILVLLFIFLSLAATGMAIAANQRARHRSQNLKDSIAGAGNDVQRTIRAVIDSMTKIQYLLLPYDQETTKQLNVTTHRLGKESRIIQRFVQKNGRLIDIAIQASYVSHLTVVSINLFILVFAFVPLLLHWHPGFIMVIFLCWILTSLFWVLAGFDFFLHTFAEDICSAFEGFVQNPHNNTLTSILPCMDTLHSDRTLLEISLAIHNFISQLNSKIAEAIRSFALDKQSKASSELGLICDPFLTSHNNSYLAHTCSNGAIPIGEFPNILSRFTCYKNDSPETCRTTGKFIPESSYRKAWAYSNSVQGMLNIFPDLQSLTQCRVVKETFSTIVLNQCEPFKVSVYRLWASMLALSVFMVVLVLLWLAKAYQEVGKSFSRFFIRPTVSHQRADDYREQL